MLIKSAFVVHPSSAYHGSTVDILIANGKILAIGKNLDPSDAEVFDAKGLKISLGWIDLRSHIGEPGFEQKETLKSAAAAALRGGFTHILQMPNTLPVLDNASMVKSIIEKSHQLPISILPVGALSQQMAGKDISEMYDMAQSGAVAFSDDKLAVHDTGLMLRAMQYAQNMHKPIMHFAEDKYLSANNYTHESAFSLNLGLKGIAPMAETIALQRDIALAEYTACHLHVMGVSSKEAVLLIKEAKSKGLNISADVAAYQLIYNEEALQNFDSNYKVKPILRSEIDRLALITALSNGTIDAICSDHTPHEIECKDLELDYAEFGMTGLETTFAALVKIGLALETIIEKLAIGPRKILSLPYAFEVAASADFTLFSDDNLWTYHVENIKSASRNTPMVGESFKARATHIFHKNKLQVCF